MEWKPWEDVEERWEDAEEGPPWEEEEEGEVVYVAVGREFDEGKATLLWALWNSSPEDEIVVVHVYHPTQMIPSMGSEVDALDDSRVREYQKLAMEKMNKILDKYLALCSKAKMRATKLLVQMNDVGQGLLEMIAHYEVSNLVIGAAADKHYLSNMNGPISKTASYVQQHADPSCKIWFVCKGNLICIRYHPCWFLGTVASKNSI